MFLVREYSVRDEDKDYGMPSAQCTEGLISESFVIKDSRLTRTGVTSKNKVGRVRDVIDNVLNSMISGGRSNHAAIRHYLIKKR